MRCGCNLKFATYEIIKIIDDIVSIPVKLPSGASFGNIKLQKYE